MLESTLPREAAYDAVGRYDQDAINGFSEALIEKMLELAELDGAESVLDAMGGDGNLTRRLSLYCQQRGLARPARTVVEFSRVQREFARAELEADGVRVIWGDAISMTDLENNTTLSDESFDRVLIKSALHEFPLESQLPLYQSIWRVLKPGGLFVTMGFLFEDAEERDEFREITRVKDRLAGLEAAVRDRYFMLRDELHSRLERAGFADVRDAHEFEYLIRSEVAGDAYFSRPGHQGAMLELQTSQVRALKLRRVGRVRFEGEHSVMQLPGRITICRKPTVLERTGSTFRAYPYDFVRKLRCHAELMDRAQAHVREGARVADLGCGPGLFAERLTQRGVTYRGVDVSPEFVARCRERLGHIEGFRFDRGDLNTLELPSGAYDVVAILNTLYLEGIDVLGLLKRALAALKPGGVLIVSGPNGPDSYERVEPHIREQAARDALLPEHEETLREILRANRRLLTPRANYYSVEGMLALLCKLGGEPLPGGHASIYYGAGYVVAVRV